MNTSYKIDSIESLYKVLSKQDSESTKAHLMLKLRSVLTEVSNFDPITGQPLSTGYCEFVDAMANSMRD